MRNCLEAIISAEDFAATQMAHDAPHISGQRDTLQLQIPPVAPLVLILEPNCTGLSGHYMRSIEEIVRAIAPSRSTVVVNAKMKRGLVLEGIETHHLFSTTVSDIFDLGRPPEQWIQRRLWRLKRLHRSTLTKAFRFIERAVRSLPKPIARAATTRLTDFRPGGLRWPDLTKVINETGLSDADHVVIPTADPDLILELLELLLARAASRIPSIHARFISAEYRHGNTDLDQLFRRVAEQPALSGRLFFYVETERMQRFFMKQYRIRTELFPHLLGAPETEALQNRQLAAGEKQVIFGYLGNARPEKGFNRLLPIIRAVVGNPAFDKRRTGFIVQVNASATKTQQTAAQLIEGASQLDAKIELHHGPATSAKYNELLKSIDCLLLPYDSDRYRLSSSGILFEALVHGKPFICSSGLSFSEYARAGNAIEAEDDSAFAEAVLRVANNPAPFVEAAKNYALGYHGSLQNNVLVQRLQHRANESSPSRVLACSRGEVPMIRPGG